MPNAAVQPDFFGGGGLTASNGASMNICLLTSTFLPHMGGLEIVVHNLATALTREGHKVIVVTPFSRRYKVEDHYEYGVIRIGFKGVGRLGLMPVVAALSLAWLVRRYKIDLIHVHNVFTPSSWAYWYGRINRRIPIVGTPHGDDIQITPEIGDGVRLNPKSDREVRRNLSSFKMVTAISPSIRKDIESILQDREKIVDIPNGVWVKNFQGAGNRQQVRQKYNIPQDMVTVIAIGRNHKRKGFNYAIEALARLRQKGLPVCLVLVGRTMEPLVEQARSLSVANHLITPGQLPQDEIAHLLQAADIFLSSAIVESFGLTTLEAMAAGLPCVLTDTAGSRDLFKPQLGFMVPPADSLCISQAIESLVESRAMREQMGDAARRHAQCYDWPKVARQYLAVYKKAFE